MNIPKIVHQTYKNHKLNETFQLCQTSVKKCYPDFEYNFYTDTDMERFVKKFYPDFKKAVFDKLPIKIMKIDVFRYLLLEKFGGLYSDLDHRSIKTYPFEGGDLYLPKSRDKNNGDKKDLLGNCILASVPDHPFWTYVKKELEENINNIVQIYKRESSKKDFKMRTFVIDNTGPKFLTNVYFKYQKELSEYNVVVLPRYIFHRKKPKNGVMLERYINDKDTYGFHYCSGTWLK